MVGRSVISLKERQSMEAGKILLVVLGFTFRNAAKCSVPEEVGHPGVLFFIFAFGDLSPNPATALALLR
jgi:hypothetical protein